MSDVVDQEVEAIKIVLGALSPVGMNHHAGGVDIGDFEVESFVKPQAAGVYGGEIGIVLESFDAGQNASDFLHAKDGGKSSGKGRRSSDNSVTLNL